MYKYKLDGTLYIKYRKPLEIVVGKTYKNFRGHWRTVIDVVETTDGVKVNYIDDTNTVKFIKIDSFRQWIKKNYY